MAHTGTETYKSTSVYRSLVASKSITPSAHDNAKYVPNFSTVSNTWDVRHLDKFLQKSEWGQNSPSNFSISKLVEESSPKGSPKKSMFTSPKITLGSPKNLTESFFVRNEPRNANVPQREYLHNIYKDFGAKEAKNDLNTLVLLSGFEPEALGQRYKPTLSPFGKTFDPSKLEMTTQEEVFMSPKQRRQQVEEVKQNQIEFDKWTGKIKELTKMQRVYKNGFRSGIIGFDNPIMSDTLLYKEENDRYLTKLRASEIIGTRRKQELLKRERSHPAIEFLNRQFNEVEIKPPTQIVQKNMKRQVDLPHVENWKDSRNRLFGEIPSKSSDQRKTYLVEMDKRGRKWDIISGKIDC